MPFRLVILVVLGAVCYKHLERVYRVYAHDPIAVMDAVDGGYVELEGTARPAKGTLESPFTETNCLFCEWTIDRRRKGTWKTIAFERDAVPFLVDDGTGTVLVEPVGSNIHLSETEIVVESDSEPPAEIRTFLEEQYDRNQDTWAPTARDGRSSPSRRFSERRLEPGETVHVLGHARRGRDGLEYAGSVNAIVSDRAVDGESSPRADGTAESHRGSTHVVRRFWDRLMKKPLVISDTAEVGATWRIAKRSVLVSLVALYVAGAISWTMYSDVLAFLSHVGLV